MGLPSANLEVKVALPVSLLWSALNIFRRLVRARVGESLRRLQHENQRAQKKNSVEAALASVHHSVLEFQRLEFAMAMPPALHSHGAKGDQSTSPPPTSVK